MIRTVIVIFALLFFGISASGVAAKNRPANQSGIAACMSDPGATNKYRGSASSPFASCCYDDGCWSCTDAVKPGQDAVCMWLPAPLAFPIRKPPVFNQSDILEPSKPRPPTTVAPPKGGSTLVR